MKTYRRHYCSQRHRLYSTMAKCIWHHAVWVVGEGPYALLAHCRGTTVSLWTEQEDALSSKEFIDRLGCGGRCHRDHEIVRLELPL